MLKPYWSGICLYLGTISVNHNGRQSQDLINSWCIEERHAVPFGYGKSKNQGNHFHYTMPPLSSIGSYLHLCFFWVKTKQRHTETREHTMHTIIRSFTNTPKHVRNTKEKKSERQRRIPTFHITLLFYSRAWRFIQDSDSVGKVLSSYAHKSKKISRYMSWAISRVTCTLFGMWRRIARYKFTDVSGECTTSILRVQ